MKGSRESRPSAICPHGARGPSRICVHRGACAACARARHCPVPLHTAPSPYPPHGPPLSHANAAAIRSPPPSTRLHAVASLSHTALSPAPSLQTRCPAQGTSPQPARTSQSGADCPHPGPWCSRKRTSFHKRRVTPHGRAVPCHSHTPRRPRQGRHLVSHSLCNTPQPGLGHAALMSGGKETGEMGSTQRGQRPRNGQTHDKDEQVGGTGQGRQSWASPPRSEAPSALQPRHHQLLKRHPFPMSPVSVLCK